jgi:hypothetical protein
MDSSHFFIWNLFQIDGADGEEKTMKFSLIYYAVGIFSFLLIGLVLTVLEFKTMNEDEKK